MTENLTVRHGYVETKEELDRFRNSKYVQSEIGDCYKVAKRFLTEGRFVCFRGTPCQINGNYIWRQIHSRSVQLSDIKQSSMVCNT